MKNQEVLQPNEPALDVMAQFDQYLAQQTPSKQAFHKWMTYLMAASAGIIVAVFVKALLVSIRWTQVNPLEIPFWWMAFAASVLPFAICLGLDTIILKAVLPLPRGQRQRKADNQQLGTGNRAILSGLFIILIGVVWAGIALAFAYSILTFNLNVIEIASHLLGIVIGIAVAVQVISNLLRHFSRSIA